MMTVRRNKGFTLAEILMATLILTLCLAIVGGLVWRGMIAYNRGKTAAQLQQTCRTAVDRVSADLRQAYLGTVNPSVGRVRFIVKDAQTSADATIEYYLSDKNLYRQVNSGNSTVAASDITALSAVQQDAAGKLWKVSATASMPRPGTTSNQVLTLAENAELRSSETDDVVFSKDLGLVPVSSSSGGSSSSGSSGGSSSGGWSSSGGGTSSGGSSSSGGNTSSSGGTTSSSGGHPSSSGGSSSGGHFSSGSSSSGGSSSGGFPSSSGGYSSSSGGSTSSSGGINNSQGNSILADLLNITRRTDRVVENVGNVALNIFDRMPIESRIGSTAFGTYAVTQGETLRRVTSSISGLSSLGLAGLGAYDAYQGFSNGNGVAGWTGVANTFSGLGSALSVVPSTLNIGNTALNMSSVAGTFGGGLAVAPVLGGIGGAINVGVGGYQMYQGYQQQNGDMIVRGGLQTLQGGLAVASAICFMTGAGAPVGAVLLGLSLAVAGAQLAYDIIPESWRNSIASGALSAANFVANGIRTVASSVSSAATSAFNFARNAASSVAESVRNTVATVSSAVRNTVTSAANAVRNTVAGVASAVRNTVSRVSSAISSTISRVSSAVSSVVNRVASAVQTTVSRVTSAISDGYHAVTNAVSNAWNATTNAVSNAWNTTTTAVSNAWNATTNAVSNAWDATTNFASNAWNTITSW